MYYIPSIHKYISVQWYLYTHTQVTFMWSECVYISLYWYVLVYKQNIIHHIICYHTTGWPLSKEKRKKKERKKERKKEKKKNFNEPKDF